MLGRRHAITILAVLLAGAAVAKNEPGGEPLDLLIQRSGLDAQLSHFEGAMQRGISAAHGAQRKLANEDVARLRKAVATAYAASSLRPVLRNELAKTLAPGEIAAALAWLDSPTGRKLTALEEKAATPEAQQRIEAASRGRAPVVAPARARILHELITATRADEVGASLLIETAAGVTEGAALFAPGDPSAARRRRAASSRPGAPRWSPRCTTTASSRLRWCMPRRATPSSARCSLSRARPPAPAITPRARAHSSAR